jgi:hypothetical protein
MSQQGAEPSEGKQALSIEVNIDGLTFDDMELIDDLAGANVSYRQMKEVLNKFVVGGVGHLPITTLPVIAAALKEKITGMGNTVTDQGN